MKINGVSIIVPIWNEEEAVQPLVNSINEALRPKAIAYEIIFINDCSTDNTSKVINELVNSFPIVLLQKQGKRGKAFSLQEGIPQAKYDNICMIDADLQYPPEAIPDMLLLLDKADIVVGNRKTYNDSFLRKTMSRGFRTFFGKFLFNLPHDIQSGLKLFKKEVWKYAGYKPSSGWSFDLEFLYKAQELGFTITDQDIVFEGRSSGKSKVNYIKTIWELGTNAFKTRLKKIHPHHIVPDNGKSMIGAGIRFNKKKYITHTILSYSNSAFLTINGKQKATMLFFILLITTVFMYRPLNALLVTVGILSFIYFIDVLFNLYLIWKSLYHSNEISFSNEELEKINEKKLPFYSILCPLYKEAHVVPQFVEAISKLEWPKNKLDAILLLEEDDKETIETVFAMNLPSFVRSVIVPHSAPKTKPKACNYGLAKAKGELLVIYDAEDIPDPLQLKKAYLGFKKVNKDVICLQAKLNYYNPHDNLLTRLFTAEYSLWFDLSLTGLQSLGTSLPLGGTSNHFKTKDLKKLQGWDPFNVTEDADLGVRLFRSGYKTAVIDSTTLEEANSKVKNWIRQRSRWIKGYMQTYLVHMRDVSSFTRKQGIHCLIFNLTIGGKIAFILINPLLWIMTISYFVFYKQVGSTIEYLYPSYIFYMAVISLIFGNFLFIYYYMIGAIKREQWSLIKYIFFVPVYWIMISFAGFVALYQLIFKPHYWEKTIHGFHLKASAKKVIPEIVVETGQSEGRLAFPVSFRKKIINIISNKEQYTSGGVLIASVALSNFVNLLFNVYLGRSVDYATFGMVSLITSFLYVSSIPLGALSSTVNFRIGFLEGRYGKESAHSFWKFINDKIIILSLTISIIWVFLSPFLSNYFNVNELLPIILFFPAWLFGFSAAVNKGLLFGKLMFVSVAAIYISEPILKLVSAYLLVQNNLSSLVYISIPFSVAGSFFISLLVVSRLKPQISNKTEQARDAKSFPMKYFTISLLSGLSTITFLSIDVILAKHFLSPEDAGRYGLVSLIGKIIFFLNSLVLQFISPFVSRNEGANKATIHILNKTITASIFLISAGFLVIGLFGYITIPFVFGEKANSILQFLMPFSFSMAVFSLSRIFVSYYLTKRVYTFPLISFFLAILQIILISKLHTGIEDIVMSMIIVGTLNLLFMIILHLNVSYVRIFENNVKDFLDIFGNRSNIIFNPEEKLRILIFNWRDTRHRLAGGAEVYVHEIAKRWVQDGNTVTVFCGNDSHCARNQVIDGVQVIRRGGFYTVYFWAFVYYILKFKGKYDLIVDSENGIPFLTPIFVRKPIFLLIHHVHQEVFKQHLKFPLSSIALFVEGKIMPFLYWNKTIITVSDSSKKDILKLGFCNPDSVIIIHPGLPNNTFFRKSKASIPTFIYLGRLKPYKNIDVLINAFHKVLKDNNKSLLYIVGEGESMMLLKKQVADLGLDGSVIFTGRVNDHEKVSLLAKSWAAVQPSQIEGWGITVIEANACGTPVVASNVNGLRDSIVDKETGILVEPGNPDLLAKSMIHIIDSKKLRNYLSKEAYVWSNNFNWDKSANDFYKIIINSAILQPKKQYIEKAELIRV